VSRLLKYLPWIGLALLGAGALAMIALNRGEKISAAWLLTAAVCVYLIGYRFYSRIIASDIFGLDATRATPAERLDDGRDYVPTNKWVRWSVRPSPRSSDSYRVPCGSWSASCWAAPCRIS